MDLQSIGISNAFTAPCFYSFQHAHAGGLQIHPNVIACLLMTYSVDIIRRTHVIYIDKRLISLMCSMQCLYVGLVSVYSITYYFY